VSAVNDAPVASAQSLSTPESTAIAITLAGSDPEGYAVTYQVSGTPGHGTLSGTAPNLTYTPTTYYNGGDSLSFTVTDSEGVVSPAATVSISVTPVNQAPVALNRSLPVTLNTATAIVLTGSDVDNNTLTYIVLSQPAHGTLTGTAPNLTYTPAAGYNSTDSFTFKVNDGTVDSANIATVYLSIGAIEPGIASEFFQNPPNLYSWPDMANLLPDDTRIDTQMSLSYGDFPAGYGDHFSSQHVAYLNITNGGNYGFSISADDNSRVYVDETLVIQQTFPQAGYSAPIFLTPGYHGIRVEFVEGYGDNYFRLLWYGPGVSGNIPASAFFRWVGYTATAAPPNLAVMPGNTVASLSWSAVGRASSYNLKRSTTSGGPYTTIANLTDASHLDTGLINGTTYYYVVSSIGAQGEGVNSAEISVTPVASASLVTFTETNLNLNLLTDPTGAEIRNDGTRVRAYHFGTADLTTDVTVHGVLFTKGGAQGSFTDTAMGNWVSGYAGWNGDWNLNSITDPAYRQLLNSMVMASSSSTITIGSLIPGHTYRLQLISNNPRHGQISVEGNTHTLSGGDNANPVVLAAQWVAGDDTLNMSMLNNDMHFNAYALHDLTATSQVADASTSTVTAQPSSVTANGIATATLSVTLKDSNNSPVAGKSVTLAKTSGPGSPVITTLAGTTDSLGLATFTVKSTTTGTDVFTATDTTDGVVINQTASVTFTAVSPVAGVITWGPATDDTLNGSSTAFVQSDVNTNGTFVAAVTNGGGGTVNGVPFQGATAYSGAPDGITSYGSAPISLRWTADGVGGTRNGPYGGPGNQYGSFGYDNGSASNLILTGGGEGNSPGTITLGSLVVGNSYQVQIWAPTWDNTFTISVGGVGLRVGNPPGTVSQYVVGTFTANGASQTIPWSGIAPSAISLRDVTSAPPATAYETWAANPAYTGFDLSTPAADADHDSLSNFMEFAFGLDPTTGASVNPITPLHGNQFSYTKRANSGLTYTVEYSTDLTRWNPVTASESAGAADSNGVQTVTVTVTNAALNGKLFVRVKAR
jgi:hypothetical protein